MTGFKEWFGQDRSLLDEGVLVSRHEIEYIAPLTFRHAPIAVEMWVHQDRRRGVRPRVRRARPRGRRRRPLRAGRDEPRGLRLRRSPGRAGSARTRRRSSRGCAALRFPSGGGGGDPRGPRLVLDDAQGYADLRTFVTRARQLDEDGAVRLQAEGTVLAAYVGVLPGRGLMGDGAVVGLRTMRLAPPATRRRDRVPGGARPTAWPTTPAAGLELPPVTVQTAWAALTPPRAGWEPVGSRRRRGAGRGGASGDRRGGPGSAGRCRAVTR